MAGAPLAPPPVWPPPLPLKAPPTPPAAQHAGERVLERAGLKGQRVLGTLGGRLAARIGRGMMVALPALGSLFVLHLVKQDRK